LFKREFSTPLLKCLYPNEAAYALEDVHEGIAGKHLGRRTLARKILRAGYYWLMMKNDAMKYVKKCDKC